MCSYICAPFLQNFSLGVLNPHVLVCGFLLYFAVFSSIKSLNFVSLVNFLSLQNILKTTSKILFDDVTVTSLHLSAMHYNRKIEDAQMINCAKFHQVLIKTEKVMGGGMESNPLDCVTRKAWTG